MVIWTMLAILLAVQLLEAFLFRYWLNLASWGALAAESFLLAVLAYQLRKRRSLRWRVRNIAVTLRQPTVIDVRKLTRDIVGFKTFSSSLFYWILLGIGIFPISTSRVPFSYFQEHFSAAPFAFFKDVWQVHATILGFFLVLLTFVFQLVSYRLAYETSLLPFLAEQSRFGPIVALNFSFLFLDALAMLGDEHRRPTIIFRYVCLLGLAFAILSSLFLLFRTLTLLKPDTVEEGLSTLIRKEFIERLEQEQEEALAENLLADECLQLELEYSPLDFSVEMAAVRSARSGMVTDLDLAKLKTFASQLKGRVPAARDSAPKAIVLKSIGNGISAVTDVLARVSPKDDTEAISRLLNTTFKVLES